VTTYKIPAAPDVDTVWLTIASGSTIRVCRDGLRWRVPNETVAHTWTELLALGEVSDVHPDLPADAPLPWSWLGQNDGIEDANGDSVYLSASVGPFLVAAVNAYGERVAGGDAQDVVRKLNKLADDMERVLALLEDIEIHEVHQARRLVKEASSVASQLANTLDRAAVQS
jgi:hypothetical protein